MRTAGSRGEVRDMMFVRSCFFHAKLTFALQFEGSGASAASAALNVILLCSRVHCSTQGDRTRTPRNLRRAQYLPPLRTVFPSPPTVMDYWSYLAARMVLIRIRVRTENEFAFISIPLPPDHRSPVQFINCKTILNLLFSTCAGWKLQVYPAL